MNQTFVKLNHDDSEQHLNGPNYIPKWFRVIFVVVINIFGFCYMIR